MKFWTILTTPVNPPLVSPFGSMTASKEKAPTAQANKMIKISMTATLTFCLEGLSIFPTWIKLPIISVAKSINGHDADAAKIFRKFTKTRFKVILISGQ